MSAQLRPMGRVSHTTTVSTPLEPTIILHLKPSRKLSVLQAEAREIVSSIRSSGRFAEQEDALSVFEEKLDSLSKGPDNPGTMQDFSNLLCWLFFNVVHSGEVFDIEAEIKDLLSKAIPQDMPLERFMKSYENFAEERSLVQRMDEAADSVFEGANGVNSALGDALEIGKARASRLNKMKLAAAEQREARMESVMKRIGVLRVDFEASSKKVDDL